MRRRGFRNAGFQQKTQQKTRSLPEKAGQKVDQKSGQQSRLNNAERQLDELAADPDDPLQALAPAEDPAQNAKKKHRQAINTAIGLLARREHAQAEIRRKLRHRGFDDDTTNEVVDELTRQRLLSDERFAEAFIRSRADRGQGPVRLRAELRQLKIPVDLIEQRLNAVVDNGLDWIALAAEVRLRRFGTTPPAAMSERAKQVRFLQYRGFTADHIRAALRVSPGMECEDILLEESGEDSSEGADEYDLP